MLIAFVVIAVLIIAGLLAFTRRGNNGRSDYEDNSYGQNGAARDNTPRGGNSAAR
jgi:hypothetical protein